LLIKAPMVATEALCPVQIAEVVAEEVRKEQEQMQ
jgi:hypothetical protein